MEPPRFRLFVATVFLLAPAHWVASQDVPEKAPVPDSAAQTRAEAIVRRLYSSEYRDAKLNPEAAQKLATALLRESKATKDDPVLRFAGLAQARDLAALAGDAVTTLQAIDELLRHYPVKALRMKTTSLTTAAARATGKEANQGVVEAALHLIDEALFEDDYDAARLLIEAAETAGVRVKNLALYGRVDRRAREVEAARQEFARMKPYADRLAKDPADPEANFLLGKYSCVIKGNWERGAPLLAMGSNEVWKTLGERELARPKEPRKQVDVGDECARLAEAEQGQAKRNLQRRALHWYRQALPKLEGLTRVRIERETRELATLFPSPESAVEIAAEVQRISNPHVGGVQAAALSPDGKRVLSGGFSDKVVRLWDAQTAKEIRQFPGHMGNVQCVAFSPDGKLGASGCTSFQLRLWDLEKGTMVLQFFGHTDFVRGVAFLPGGKRLVSAADDKTLRIWDLSTGNELRRLMGHTAYINSLALTKDGTRAITASDDGTARVWDLDKGTEIHRINQGPQRVQAAALSPDGKWAITSGADKTVRLWEVATGKELHRLPHPSTVWVVAWSPDGRTVLTGSGFPPDPKGKTDGLGVTPDNFVRIWDAETGKELRRLEGHTALIRVVGLASDGRLALSASNDSTIRIWGERK